MVSSIDEIGGGCRGSATTEDGFHKSKNGKVVDAGSNKPRRE